MSTDVTDLPEYVAWGGDGELGHNPTHIRLDKYTALQVQMKDRDTLFAKIKYSLENSSRDKVWLIQEDWEKLVEYAGDIVGYVPCAESRQYHHSGGQS